MRSWIWLLLLLLQPLRVLVNLFLPSPLSLWFLTLVWFGRQPTLRTSAMPAAVSSRNNKHPRATRDGAPPAKKPKLAQASAASRHNGLKALINGASTQKPTAEINGTTKQRSHRVDEATVVVGGSHAGHADVDMEDAPKDVIEISSAEEEDESDSEGDDADEQREHRGTGAAPAVNGTTNAHDQDRIVDEEIVDPEELSFGDRLQAQEPESESTRESRIVDVESEFAGDNTESKSLAVASQNRALSATSSQSWGTLLTQALRTNDQDLLDSCLRDVDVKAIYHTVERLPSPLVGNLLQKLAETLHKKPGRAGELMVWVQWSLAAHGGYLASQPQLVRQLATLNKVLKERANGLQPLLSLKGRLDMLHAQLELRRRNQQRAADDDEDEAVIYVEDEDDYLSSDDESAAADLETGNKRLQGDYDIDEESSDDEMPTTMEADEDSEEESEESGDLLDDEAEETDHDSGDELSDMSDDFDEDGEAVSGSEEESKPARRSTAARAGLKSRR